jgi:hypothetical protein
MSRSVVIAALGKKHCGVPVYRPGMEVWGINDAYDKCPEISRFYKIYNIHKAFPECAEDMPGRYKNWRNKYEQSKALIITAKNLGLSKQRVLDISALIKDNPDYCFCSSVSYAIFEAVQKGYKEIRLYRLSLNDGEYSTQGAGIISNIKWAQRHGVKVYWPWYKSIVAKYGNDIFRFNKDINQHYGETAEKGFSVGKLTVKALKQQIKSLDLPIPHNAKKRQLVEILEKNHGNK